MTVQLQFQTDGIPVSAHVTIGDSTYTFPIRKSIEGWAPSVPLGFPSEQSFQAQLAIAAAILRQ